jgi:hypothetical protein
MDRYDKIMRIAEDEVHPDNFEDDLDEEFDDVEDKSQQHRKRPFEETKKSSESDSPTKKR